MTLSFKNVPYRRWHSRSIKGTCRLKETAQYSRIMAIVGKAINDGKAVSFDHEINCPEPKRGAAYDLISVTIQD